MSIDHLQAKRTPEGIVDIQHYARIAHAERREAKTAAMRLLGRSCRRALTMMIGFVAFWNIPPMGPVGSKDVPYR